MLDRLRASVVAGAFVAGVLFSASTAGVRADNGPVATPSEIQQSLDRYAGAYNQVGIVAGVVTGGKATIYTAGSLGKGAAVLNEDTEFEIGSVTKTFTATLLAEMVQSGAVKLDDPISKYLPKSVTAPAYGGQQITLLDLAEQNSGLPRLPSNLKPANPNDPYADYTPALLDAFLSHYALTRAPGATYEYSNLGVGLLGYLLGLRAGSSYQSALEARVLKPLGMKDSAVTATAAMTARLAPGHTVDGNPQGRWTMSALAGAGGLVSSGHDMVAFLQANLAAPNGTLGKAMASAQEPRFDTDLGGRPMKIGLVWNVDPRDGITWHNGETGGYHTFIGFDHAAGNGVVLLANVADMNLDLLAMHLLEPDAVSAPPAWPAVVQVPNATLDSYAGVYQMAPEFSVTISHDGQSVYAQATGQDKARIYPSSPTEFYFRIVSAQISFETDTSGKVTRLILHQAGRDLPGPKVK